MSDILDTLRMCVAEAGYDPASIREPIASTGQAALFRWDSRAIPRVVMWRARETAGVAEPRCKSCFCSSANSVLDVHRQPRCTADRRFLEACSNTENP